MDWTKRYAALAATILAIGASIVAAGVAQAAPIDVSFRLESGTTTIGDLPPFAPNESTGVTGTWDDVTGDFTGTYVSAPTAGELDTEVQVAPPPAPKTPAHIVLTVEQIAKGPVTGTIDPDTGIGTSSLDLRTEIIIQTVSLAG